MDNYFNELALSEVEVLWNIQDFFFRHPKIDRFFSKIVSKHPWFDVCSIIWYIFIIGILQIGRKHFWVVSLNLSIAFVVRKLIEAKRPVEFDRKLQPMSDIHPESFGFPSLETHMSVVIMGHIYIHYYNTLRFYQSSIVVCLAVILGGIVGVSRLYARSRFPYQIYMSYLTGLIGLILSMRCCSSLRVHEIPTKNHWYCVGFVILGLLVNLFLNMENNESRLGYIPKQEFIKVIGGILNNTTEGSKTFTEVCRS